MGFWVIAMHVADQKKNRPENPRTSGLGLFSRVSCSGWLQTSGLRVASVVSQAPAAAARRTARVARSAGHKDQRR